MEKLVPEPFLKKPKIENISWSTAWTFTQFAFIAYSSSGPQEPYAASYADQLLLPHMKLS